MAYLSYLTIGIPAQGRLVFRNIYPQEVEVVVSPEPGEEGGVSKGPTIRGRRRYIPTRESLELRRREEEEVFELPKRVRYKAVGTMSAAEIQEEIGLLLRARLEQEEEERLLILLIALACP